MIFLLVCWVVVAGLLVPSLLLTAPVWAALARTLRPRLPRRIGRWHRSPF